MSGTQETTKDMNGEYRIPAGSTWSRAWQVALGIAAVGLVTAVAGYGTDPDRFAFSYLFAFGVVMTIGLGGMFFVLAQHLTASAWSVTVRRVAEFLMGGLPVVALLALPLMFFFAPKLYPWHGDEHGIEVHGAPSGARDHKITEHDLEMVATERTTGDDMVFNDGALHHAHAEVIAWKLPYLNKAFFLVRGLLCLIAWLGFGWFLFRNSTAQDHEKSVAVRDAWTVKSQRIAPIATIVFALTLTMGAVDWFMSLEPTWYSTIFGVYVFAGALVAVFSLVILISLGLRSAGVTGNAITTEHFHDLGKLLFGFNVFWAYIGFSQFMLIWYASIPEETTYYHARWAGSGWKALSLSLLFFHFVFPFIFLISRNVKRRLPMLAFGAAWLLAMHVLDVFWMIMPYASHGAFSVHFMDVGLLFFTVGTFFTAVFWRMNQHPVIPIGDPRLARALRFINA